MCVVVGAGDVGWVLFILMFVLQGVDWVFSGLGAFGGFLLSLSSHPPLDRRFLPYVGGGSVFLSFSVISEVLFWF
jgi:hypothetical protein